MKLVSSKYVSSNKTIFHKLHDLTFWTVGAVTDMYFLCSRERLDVVETASKCQTRPCLWAFEQKWQQNLIDSKGGAILYGLCHTVRETGALQVIEQVRCWIVCRECLCSNTHFNHCENRRTSENDSRLRARKFKLKAMLLLCKHLITADNAAQDTTKQKHLWELHGWTYVCSIY